MKAGTSVRVIPTVSFKVEGRPDRFSTRVMTQLARAADLQRFAKNLNHQTLPEIIDFNALGDAFRFKYFAKRVNSGFE